MQDRFTTVYTIMVQHSLSPLHFFTPGANYWVDVTFAATPVNLNNMVFNNSTLKVYGNGTV